MFQCISGVVFVEDDSNEDDEETEETSPTPSPIQSLDPIIEYDGYYYNYMPQCALSFGSFDDAIAFITDFRNHSSEMRRNLHNIIEYYLVHNITLLFATTMDNDATNNETLYDYIQDNGYL